MGQPQGAPSTVSTQLESASQIGTPWFGQELLGLGLTLIKQASPLLGTKPDAVQGSVS